MDTLVTSRAFSLSSKLPARLLEDSSTNTGTGFTKTLKGARGGTMSEKRGSFAVGQVVGNGAVTVGGLAECWARNRVCEGVALSQRGAEVFENRIR